MKIPENDSREFAKFTLDNGIPVVYVKDLKLEKPIFNLSVKTGYFNDPKDREGLAHFLEHLIFMGSEKYPQENKFNEELAKCQGMTNAYTDSDKTIYYFSCVGSGFEEILDIFYNLIKSPLLSESSLEREVNAVNAEHEKNVLNDNWRFFHLLGLLSKEDHVFRKFGTGNLETLNKDDTISKVREFYDTYYHKNNFYICMADSKDSDYYKKLLNSNFGTLNKDIERNSFNFEKPYVDFRNVLLESENNNKKLYLVWNIEKLENDENPVDFINELVGNMQVNSLQKVLSEKKYIKTGGISSEEEDKYMLIKMGFRLTDFGIKNINNILMIVKKYFDFLGRQNVNKLIDEYKKKMDIFFNYDERPDSFKLTSEIITNMMETKEVLYYDFDYKNVTQQMFQKVISKLDINYNMVLMLPKDKVIDTIIVEKDNIDKYYEMKYYDIKVNQKVNKKMLDEIEFEIPKLNEYVSVPLLVDEHSEKLVIGNRNFYRFDKSWNTPVVYTTVIVDFPYFDDNYLQIHQTIMVLAYQIRDYFYDALLLGYNINIIPNPIKKILVIEVSGYNTKIDKLLNEFFDNLKSLGNLEKYLNLVNLEYKDDLERYKTMDPLKYGMQNIKNILLNDYKTSKELYDSYRELSAREYFNILGKILDSKKIYYQYGNFRRKISNENTFNINITRNNMLKDLEVKHPNKKEKNSGLFILYNLGEYNIKNDTYSKLLNSIMAEKFFDELRTKNQVGYLVGQGTSNINNNLYLMQRIQTQKELGGVIKMVNNFNKSFVKELEEMSDDDFDRYKYNMRKSLKKPYEDISERYYEDLNEILTTKLLFDRRGLMVKELKKISKNMILSFLRGFVNKGKIVKVD